MKIAYNPKTAAVITAATAANDDILFDLNARKVWAKGLRMGADWADISSKPSSLKNPYAIKFRDINGNEVSYDGSSAKDLTTGTYIAKLPYGFSSWRDGVTWGNTTGTSIASWNDSSGGSIDFRKDNPSSGKLSIKVDGRVYVNEGVNPVLSAESNNGFWGMRTPDGGNDWIRTSNNGLLPYVNGNAGSGHSSLGTNTWYFSTAYIDKVYGSLKGNADTATTATTALKADKLTNARNISLGTDLRGSANFDGSGNITINATINSCWVSVYGTNGLPFKRIAHFETGNNYNDNALLLYISQGYINGSNGICRVEFRTDNISSSSTSITASAAVRWLVRNGYSLDSLYAGYYVTTGKAYIDIYLKTTGGYQGTAIRVLQDSRGSINSNVQLISAKYNSDTDYKEAYDSIEAASTALYNRAYTKIVSGSDVGTVNYAHNAGSANKWTTARTFTIGNTAKNVDGSGNVSWSLAEIGVRDTWRTVQVNGTSIGNNTLNLCNSTYIGLTNVNGKVTFSLVGSSTTANQAILSNGTANGWTLKTLNITNWDTAYNLRHSHANKSVLDGITTGLVTNWNTAYNFVSTITGTDTDNVINKWDEIVNFLAGITEDNKLNTLLNSKLSVYELADKTNVGTIKNNGIYYSTTEASTGTLTNSPFTNAFALINMTNLNNNEDQLRRCRLAFSRVGDIKVSDDHLDDGTAETWYNVLTSKNSGINGSTIKLNGTSITVYSSGTADGRYVKKSGDAMTGALNFANATWNQVGDDVAIGDCNAAGCLGIKGLNADPGLAFCNSSNTLLSRLIGTANQFQRVSGNNVFNILDTSTTSINDNTITINGTSLTVSKSDHNHDNKYLKWLGNANQSNMNAVGRISHSSGMTPLSDPGNTVDNPMEGNTKSTSWHLYWQTNYTDNPSGNNAWVAQIANRAGTDRWWVRSRSGGTITDGTDWTSNWRFLVTAPTSGLGNRNQPIYINSAGEVVAANSYPTSLKSPHALTLKANGTTLATYDGSSAKEANFTYANVGAASASHNHDGRYVRRWNGVYGSANKFLKLVISDEKGWVRLEVSDSNNALTAGYGIYMIGWSWHGQDNTDKLIVNCLYANDSRYTTALKVVRTSRNNYDFYFQFASGSSYPSYTINYGISINSIDYTVTEVSTIPTATWTSSLVALQLNASSATKVIVNQHTTNDINYPLVWSNQANTSNVTENQLYKSWQDLYYNPKNKRLTIAGSVSTVYAYITKTVISAGFIHSAVTKNANQYVLTADGGYTFLNQASNELAHEFDVNITVTSEWTDIKDFYGGNQSFLTQPGTYIVQVYYKDASADGMYEGYFSGIMSWYTGKTNSNNADEIVLHRVGHAYANTIYLRTRESLSSEANPYTKLQISANSDLKQHTYKFKFKRIC